MRKHITALIMALVFLAVIPLFTIKIIKGNIRDTGFNSDKETKIGLSAEMLAYEFREEYCPEGLKAVAVILNSNYNSGEKLNTLSKADFIKKYKNGEKYYSEIENTIKTIKNTYITYKGKPVKIPCSYLTNGTCESVYPYLNNTANPQDYINPEYKFNLTPGVSFNSVNELCEKGLNFKEALGKYIKKIDKRLNRVPAQN